MRVVSREFREWTIMIIIAHHLIAARGNKNSYTHCIIKVGDYAHTCMWVSQVLHQIMQGQVTLLVVA